MPRRAASTGQFVFSGPVDPQLKQRVLKMIVGENDRQPLSDMAIAKVLQAEGSPVARRTIAKYRNEMRVAHSWKRAVRPR